MVEDRYFAPAKVKEVERTGPICVKVSMVSILYRLARM